MKTHHYSPQAWVLEKYSPEELRDIAEHGCAACAPNGLTYYSETVAFYSEYEHEILDALDWFIRETCSQKATVWEVFGKDTETIEQLQNALVWAFVELVAQNATEG